MLFYTAQFGAFLALLLLILAVVRGAGARKAVLLIASYVFYMWWNPAFITLILLSTGVDYVIGRRLAVAEKQGRRRALLITSVVTNLGILGIFKYAGFFQQNLLWVLGAFGGEPSFSMVNIVLPVGVSFYTFQSMSYTIDVYRRRVPATRSALDFALFVAFFPQLVAGPIVRASDFLPQLDRPVRVRLDRFAVMLFLRGLAKKTIIADNLSPFADRIFDAPDGWPSIIVCVAAVCFYIQVYCDFSGYSDMAIALSSLFGFQFPVNFAHPYFTRDPAAFWRRWHISLSSWLRDYLYIGLGGSRGGDWMAARNLMLVMLLCGLWHGAGWSYVLFGAIHGVALIVWRIVGPRMTRIGEGLSGPIRLGVSVVCWAAFQYWYIATLIVFRSPDLSRMRSALTKYVVPDFDFHLAGMGLGTMAFYSTLTIIGLFSVLHVISWRTGGLDKRLARAPFPVMCGACVVLGTALYLLWPNSPAPFIYFQF